MICPACKHEDTPPPGVERWEEYEGKFTALRGLFAILNEDDELIGLVQPVTVYACPQCGALMTG
jgi:hypothetical protein